MFALPPDAAIWFLLPAVPVSLWCAYSDLSTMKIPNKAVIALFAGYVAVGPIALPFDTYLWNFLHLFIVLAVGMILNAIGGLGAGDAKFMAAAAPYVAAPDAGRVLLLLSACMGLGFILHRLMRLTFRQTVPHWASWDAGRKFPLGFPLALTLLAYLGLSISG